MKAQLLLTAGILLSAFSSGASAQELLLRHDGEIEPSAMRMIDGSQVQWHDVDIPHDTQINVMVVSVDFIPRLLIEMPNQPIITIDGEYGSVRHEMLAPATDSMRIGIASTHAATAGRYSIRLEAGPPMQQLLSDQPVSGTLQPSTATGDSRDVYRYHGTAGDIIRFRLESTDFDAYLTIADSSGTLATNDDADSNTTDSEIIHYFTTNSDVFVEASSYGGYGSGRYTLSAEAASEATDYTSGMRLPHNEEFTGLLSAADPLILGKRAQHFTIEVTQGMEIDVLMRSSAFDSYLIAESPSGQRYEDDDSGGNLDAHLSVTAEEDGIWNIYAASFRDNSTGSYTIRFRENAPRVVAHRFEGSLNESGYTIGQRVFQEHGFEAEAGHTYRIELTSDDFDTYLVVIDAEGNIVAENDDFGNSTNSRVDLETEGGSYTILAGAYSGTPDGVYEAVVHE